jgi:hypothetical protein
MNKKSLSIIAVLSLTLGNAAYAMENVIIATALIHGAAVHALGAQAQKQEAQRIDTQRVEIQKKERQRLSPLAQIEKQRKVYENEELYNFCIDDPASSASIHMEKSMQDQLYGWQISYITPAKDIHAEARVGSVCFIPYLEPNAGESDATYLIRIQAQQNELLEQERSSRQEVHAVIENFRSEKEAETKELLAIFQSAFDSICKANQNNTQVKLSNDSIISFKWNPIDFQTLIATVDLVYTPAGRTDSIVLEKKRIELPKKVDAPATESSSKKWRSQTQQEYTEQTAADLRRYYKNAIDKVQDCITSNNDPVKLYLKYEASQPQLIQGAN